MDQTQRLDTVGYLVRQVIITLLKSVVMMEIWPLYRQSTSSPAKKSFLVIHSQQHHEMSEHPSIFAEQISFHVFSIQNLPQQPFPFFIPPSSLLTFSFE